MTTEYRTLITFGYHDKQSPRYANVCKAYQKEGFTISECHTEKRGFLAKCRDLRHQYRSLETPDVLLVTFPGHYLVPLAWLQTQKQSVKLIFDAFISLSDTLVSDRKKYSWINPFSWFLYLVDLFSCHLADEILLDTEAHKRFFARRFYLRPAKIRVMYVGTREDLFCKESKGGKGGKEVFEVLFIGTYIPLQGIEVIIDAAKILQDEHRIHFTLVGGGQTYPNIRKKADDLALSNVTFMEFQPLENLPKLLCNADIALGIFGTTDKASRVIPHKVYDAVACGTPVITAKTPAILERFHGSKEVHLVPPGDPQALAKKILELRK